MKIEILDWRLEISRIEKKNLWQHHSDETTWSARTWLAFVRQRISVAIHFAAAKEIAEALKMTMATDSRDGGRVRGG